jgi:cobalt-zinc-cadmium efflux system membrane fusion protein
MRIGWKTPVILILVAGAVTWLAVDHRKRDRLLVLWNKLSAPSSHAGELRPSKDWIASAESVQEEPPLGEIVLSPDEVNAMGVKLAPVRAQAEPTILRLTGVTDYDPDTLTVVRSQFDCRVDRVLVQLGSVVKQGDPLLEVFSTDLAEAKSNYETARSQWIRDKKVLDYKSELTKDATIPRKEQIEIENDEAKSRLQMKLAKDKLLVYGLTEKEVEGSQNEDGVQKARLTLRSPTDGIVIKRTVVQGNYYKSENDLMQIAPLDHLWVLGSVSELDADKVEVGQTIRIVFPYSDRTIEDQVEYIDKAIDPQTRAAKFRASIQNPEKRLKAGMFVRVLLEIPPRPGRTVIPRTSMISVDRLDFVFVKRPTEGRNLRYERRNILVSRETSDWVLVTEPSKDHVGLKPGEEVVTNGSLILEQMHEDRLVVAGEQAKERPLDDEAFARPDSGSTVSITTP